MYKNITIVSLVAGVLFLMNVFNIRLLSAQDVIDICDQDQYSVLLNGIQTILDSAEDTNSTEQVIELLIEVKNTVQMHRDECLPPGNAEIVDTSDPTIVFTSAELGLSPIFVTEFPEGLYVAKINVLTQRDVVDVDSEDVSGGDCDGVNLFAYEDTNYVDDELFEVWGECRIAIEIDNWAEDEWELSFTPIE